MHTQWVNAEWKLLVSWCLLASCPPSLLSYSLKQSELLLPVPHRKSIPACQFTMNMMRVDNCDLSQYLFFYFIHSVSFEIPSIVAISIAIATKLCLFLYCQALAKYPSAKILAQDHRNDVFLNVFGITLSLLGALVAKWVDPVGAIIIALLIFRSWASTCYGKRVV